MVTQLPDDHVRHADQPAPTGSKPFITVKEITSTTIGSDYSFDGVEEFEYINETEEAVISINGYGKSSLARIKKVKAGLRTSAIIQKLKLAGMATVRTSPGA